MECDRKTGVRSAGSANSAENGVSDILQHPNVTRTRSVTLKCAAAQNCDSTSVANSTTSGDVSETGTLASGSPTGPRTSSRVLKRARRDSGPQPSAKKTANPISSPKLSGGENPVRRSRDLWSPEEKNWFFEALCEYGKDFDQIHAYMAQRSKRRGGATVATPQVRNKDQVRHFYYRTWHKIIHFFVDVADSIKKNALELYGLINYAEMRKRLGCFNATTMGPHLNELVLTGTTVIKFKRKAHRIRTPLCKALKTLNNLTDLPEAPRVPSEICVELRPRTNAAFARVQALAQNPRVRVRAPPQKKLASVLAVLQKRWRPLERRQREAALNTLGTLVTEAPPELCQIAEPALIRVYPEEAVREIKISPLDHQTSADVCLESYRKRQSATGSTSASEDVVKNDLKEEDQVGEHGTPENDQNDVNSPSPSGVLPASTGNEPVVSTGVEPDVDNKEGLPDAVSSTESPSLAELLGLRTRNCVPVEGENAVSQPLESSSQCGVISSVSSVVLEDEEALHYTPICESTAETSSTKAEVGTKPEVDTRPEVSTKPEVDTRQEAVVEMKQEVKVEAKSDSSSPQVKPETRPEGGGNTDFGTIINSVTSGWTVETLGLLTVGELYLMMGSPSGIVLSYEFIDDAESTSESSLNSLLIRLIDVLSVALGDKSKTLNGNCSVAASSPGLANSGVSGGGSGVASKAAPSVAIGRNNKMGANNDQQQQQSTTTAAEMHRFVVPKGIPPKAVVSVPAGPQIRMPVNSGDKIERLLYRRPQRIRLPSKQRHSQNVVVVQRTILPQRKDPPALTSNSATGGAAPTTFHLPPGVQVIASNNQILSISPSSSPQQQVITLSSQDDGSCRTFVSATSNHDGTISLQQIPQQQQQQHVICHNQTAVASTTPQPTSVLLEHPVANAMQTDNVQSSLETATVLLAVQQPTLSALNNPGIVSPSGNILSGTSCSSGVVNAVNTISNGLNVANLVNSGRTTAISDAGLPETTRTLSGDSSAVTISTPAILNLSAGANDLPSSHLIQGDLEFGGSTFDTHLNLLSTPIKKNSSVIERGSLSVSSTELQWLNGESSNMSLGTLLSTLDSPIKGSSASSSAIAVTVAPSAAHDSNSMLDSIGRLAPDVDTTLQCLLNESSVEYVAKFADLAAQIATVNNSPLKTPPSTPVPPQDP